MKDTTILIFPFIIKLMLPVIAAEYKLVLVGDSSVGKSSLLSRFVDGKFDQQLLSTIGVDFKFRRVKIGKEQIKLQIWDTAGQQTFRSIVSAYYNSADAILLCYDLAVYESFESLKEYWLPEALNNNKTNAKLFVIGNKVDCKRQVEQYSLDTLKEANVDAFYEVSAKENINVEKTFTEIAKIVHTYKKQTTKLEAPNPKSQGKVSIIPKQKYAQGYADGDTNSPTNKGCCK